MFNICTKHVRYYRVTAVGASSHLVQVQRDHRHCSTVGSAYRHPHPVLQDTDHLRAVQDVHRCHPLQFMVHGDILPRNGVRRTSREESQGDKKEEEKENKAALPAKAVISSIYYDHVLVLLSATRALIKSVDLYCLTLMVWLE